MRRARLGKCLLAVLLGLTVAALLGGCGGDGAGATDLTLSAVPRQGIQSYPGGVALWVLKVIPASGDSRQFQLAADAPAGVSCSFTPSVISGPSLVECLARPDTSLAGQSTTLRVNATAIRSDLDALAADAAAIDLHLGVSNYTDGYENEARRRFQPFLSYLVDHRRELGITRQTQWEGFVSAPGILIVTWYSFLSEDWEVLIRWHVMIPPYDWTHVYLRRRGTLRCEWAGEISTAGGAVHEIPLERPFPRFDAPLIPVGVLEN